jgi:Asp/Glu/hydantoin racemase
MKVSMISVTLNAVNPMTDAIRGSGERIELVNCLDTGLMDLVAAEGRVTDKSLCRLVGLLAKAAEDGADCVLLTCTVFSPYVERLRSLFSIPIISADGAMIDDAVKRGGRTLILCTFPATVESSTALFRSAEERHSVVREMDILLLKNAFDAIQRGDRAGHDHIILEKIRECGKAYDQIVLAQISMAHVAALAEGCPIPILTSPASALSAMLASRKL